jgi:hypothetical protein
VFARLEQEQGVVAEHRPQQVVSMALGERIAGEEPADRVAVDGHHGGRHGADPGRERGP